MRLATLQATEFRDHHVIFVESLGGVCYSSSEEISITGSATRPRLLRVCNASRTSSVIERDWALSSHIAHSSHMWGHSNQWDNHALQYKLLSCKISNVILSLLYIES